MFIVDRGDTTTGGVKKQQKRSVKKERVAVGRPVYVCYSSPSCADAGGIRYVGVTPWCIFSCSEKNIASSCFNSYEKSYDGLFRGSFSKNIKFPKIKAVRRAGEYPKQIPSYLFSHETSAIFHRPQSQVSRFFGHAFSKSNLSSETDVPPPRLFCILITNPACWGVRLPELFVESLMVFTPRGGNHPETLYSRNLYIISHSFSQSFFRFPAGKSLFRI